MTAHNQAIPSQQAAHMLRCLRDLRDGRAEINREYGICYAVAVQACPVDLWRILGQMDLPTGFPVFVPGWVPQRLRGLIRPGCITAGEQYDSASGDEMWDPACPYGAARLALLDQIISYLENTYDLGQERPDQG